MPTITVGDGGTGAPAAGQIFTAAAPGAAAVSGRRRISKRLLIPIVAVVVLLIAGALFYFGYYNNPSTLYAQSLQNTGKGYDKLIDYINQQSQTKSQSYSGSGSYQFKAGGFSTDGKLALKGNSGSSDFTFDVGLSGTRLSTDIRTIKSNATTPDIYLKASGLNGLGTMIGDPDLDAGLAKLDGNWIVIDHTLIDNLNAETQSDQSSSSAGSVSAPTRQQILDEARAFGRVNQQYLFSTKQDKALLKVVKKYGSETVDGHKTYHYQVALQKGNVKSYILAQRDALKGSQLDSWLKKNGYETSALDSLNDAANSSGQINGSNTFDLWVDKSHRIVYKVRFSDTTNPANNYVDVGLDYKGGDDYPFFLSGKSDSDGSTTNYSFTTDINTKTNGVNFKLNLGGTGSDAATLGFNFGLQPSSANVTIAKPSGAIPFNEALNDLGLGGLVSGDTGSSGSSDSNDLQLLQTGNHLPASSSSQSSADAVKDALLKHLLGHG